ncbi:MAG: response regulator transcription factor [Bacteriovoracaceae bacterium]|nr:response regulator transcription factor [Bacteriovoracaceae bacterium]
MAQILLVEDDLSLGQSLKENLQIEGFEIFWSQSLLEAQASLDKVDVDLIILDWMLPDGQGIDFLKAFRVKNKLLPVILLTARAELIDKVIGLESGADDYLTKPFEPRELIARIRARLRIKSDDNTTTDSEQNVVQLGDLKIQLDSRQVYYQNKLCELSKMEFDLLRLLAMSPGRVFHREEILNKVWGLENYPTTRTVDTHVLQLRQKFDHDLIQTVRGIGYRLKI